MILSIAIIILVRTAHALQYGVVLGFIQNILHYSLLIKCYSKYRGRVHRPLWISTRNFMSYKYDIIIADLFWTNVTKTPKKFKNAPRLTCYMKTFSLWGYDVTLYRHSQGVLGLIPRPLTSYTSHNLWPAEVSSQGQRLLYMHWCWFYAWACQASYKDVTLSWHSQGYIFSTSNDLWPNWGWRSKVIKWKTALQPGLCPMHCSVYISPEYTPDIACKS